VTRRGAPYNLTATDKAASFDVDIPESAAARDTLVYKLVDAEAARLARQIGERYVKHSRMPQALTN